jgi:hypothetical protein
VIIVWQLAQLEPPGAAWCPLISLMLVIFFVLALL